MTLPGDLDIPAARFFQPGESVPRAYRRTARHKRQQIDDAELDKVAQLISVDQQR